MMELSIRPWPTSLEYLTFASSLILLLETVIVRLRSVSILRRGGHRVRLVRVRFTSCKWRPFKRLRDLTTITVVPIFEILRAHRDHEIPQIFVMLVFLHLICN